MASDGSELLEHGTAKYYPGGLTSEDERKSPRWQKLLAVATCVALLVSCVALGRATAHLGSGWVQLAQPQMPQGLQQKEWEQAAVQRWSDLGPVHPKPGHLEELHLADWEVNDARTLHIGSGAARKQDGAEMPAELQGIIQTWSERETANGVIQTAKYKGGSAKQPTGELDHFQCLYTADWAAFYFFSDGDKDAPIVFLLDGIIMHKHYGDKLEWLPIPGNKKAYYSVKPKAEYHADLQAIMN
jgi:hypothetical protein